MEIVWGGGDRQTRVFKSQWAEDIGLEGMGRETEDDDMKVLAG